jgi:hypothetical protein
MKNVFMNARRAFAIILIAVGVLVLLQNTGIATGETGQVVSTVVLTAVGIFFTALYFPGRRQWFWIALGFVFFSFALGNIVYFMPTLDEFYRQVIIFAGIGISFLTIYLHDRMQWWAMFPAGLLISISTSQLVENLSPNLESSGILLLGLGLAFLILYLIPTPVGQLKFALLPALILLAVGVVIILGSPYNLTDYLLPGLIIIAGVVLILFTLRKKM